MNYLYNNIEIEEERRIRLMKNKKLVKSKQEYVLINNCINLDESIVLVRNKKNNREKYIRLKVVI